MSMDKNKNIPKDYFNQKPQEIFDAINKLEDDVATQAPILFSLGKNEPYRIPDDYFDGFYNKLSVPKSTLKRRTLRLQPWMAAASMIGIVFLFWVFGYDNLQQDDDIELAEVYEYYIENADLIDDSMIIVLSDDIGDDMNDVNGLNENEELDLMEQTILEEMTDQEFLDIL